MPAQIRTVAEAAWTWTPYTQAIAATATDFVACNVHLGIRMTIITLAGIVVPVNIECEFATGAAGAEVPFATIPLAVTGIIISPGAATQGIIGTGRDVPLGPTFIPSGTRIAARLRISQPATVADVYVRYFITGYDGGQAPVGNSTYTLRGQQTGIQKGTSVTTPAGSTLTVTPGSSAWGAWSQITAATTGEQLIQGVAGIGSMASSLAKWIILELGTGGAGAEVSRARIYFAQPGYGNAAVQLMQRPLLVKPGERLAVRGYSSNAAFTFDCQFLYEQH